MRNPICFYIYSIVGCPEKGCPTNGHDSPEKGCPTNGPTIYLLIQDSLEKSYLQDSPEKGCPTNGPTIYRLMQDSLEKGCTTYCWNSHDCDFVKKEGVSVNTQRTYVS
jgi:hypothetical protein